MSFEFQNQVFSISVNLLERLSDQNFHKFGRFRLFDNGRIISVDALYLFWFWFDEDLSQKFTNCLNLGKLWHFSYNCLFLQSYNGLIYKFQQTKPFFKYILLILLINLQLRQNLSMTQPASTKSQPYTEFPKQGYSIFTDDFCHEKFFVVKPTLKTSKSVIKLKETITSKKGHYSLADEVKLWFDLPRGGSLYGKWKSNDYIKVHYDDGVRVHNGKKYSLYASVNSNKSLDLLSVKLGVNHDSEHCHSDNRLKISTIKDGHAFHWYNRTMVYHNNFRFGLVTCFDICNKILQKHNILLGYNIDNNTKVYLRAENDGFKTERCALDKPLTYFDKLTFDLVRNLNETTIGGLEAVYNLKHKHLDDVRGVVQLNRPGKQIIKAGLNRYLDISLLVKRPIEWLDNSATFSAGASIDGILKKQINFRNGFEFAINL